MMTFPVPVVAWTPSIGPGSQPLEDEVLNTLDIPSEVATFRRPVTELNAPPEVVAEAIGVLEQLLAALRATPYAAGQPARLSLCGLPAAVRAEVTALLGEGEVSIQGAAGLCAQETAFTGIWHLLGEGVDEIEAGGFPLALRTEACARSAAAIGQAAEPPDDLMNAPALLHEVRTVSGAWATPRAAHVINLSLLPVTPEDLSWLDEQLGRAGFSILSRGFGNCRITATRYPNTWWVQYFNAMEKLILNSIEIVDLPAVALAAEEDYTESIERLAEWIDSVKSGM